MSERKNFSTEDINSVFEEQGHACGNCGTVFGYGGFQAHHKDGDCSNNSKDNCQLLCERCHDGKQWETLKLQKERALRQTGDIVEAALQGKMAGAVIDKLLDAIKLELSLNQQLNGSEHFDLPVSQKMAISEAVEQAKMDAYRQGIMDTLKAALPSLVEQIVKPTKTKS
jgi:hypothetical protein